MENTHICRHFANLDAHTKFGENPLMFIQVIIRKQKTDRLTTDRWTDIQRETTIPRHYCMAEYKKALVLKIYYYYCFISVYNSF